MKLAVLGGSFNPVHIGHLLLADEALSSFGYDRVILIPAFQSPFKLHTEGASPEDRLQMLMASVSGDPRLTVDDCELNREGISYTIETLVDIIDRYKPEGKPGLILGDDLVSRFNEWQRPDGIAALADFIIAQRENSSSLEKFPYPYRALNNKIIPVSSMQVREKIGKGEAWRYFVPFGARCIIEDRALYGFSGSCGTKGDCDSANFSGEKSFAGEKPFFGEKSLEKPVEKTREKIARIENDIRNTLELRRFLHSRNVALLAWDLCCRFGVDPQKGYLAGIAHDMCKDFESDKLIRLARADGGNISKLEQNKPGLLHARAAAVLTRRKYGITDKDILEAIRYHTTGTWDMGSLAKIVYVADKLEVSRTKPDPALKEMCLTEDLESLFSAVLNNTVKHLRHRQLDLSYGTRRLLAAMQRRNNSEEEET